MDQDLGQPIAYGRTAEIYAWEPGYVLKLFYDWFSLESIEYEARISGAIYASGLPVPAVSAPVCVKDRHGLIYRRVDGTPMARAALRMPWRVFHYATQMADLHAALHAAPVDPQIPLQRSRLIQKITTAAILPADLRARLLAALDTLPDGEKLCHGDFHPENILLAHPVPVVIDWIDATLGNPLADLARTSILLLGAAASKQMKHPHEKAIVRLFHDRYLAHYFQLRPGGQAEYARWLPLVAAARLTENIEDQNDFLLRQAENVAG